MIKHIREVERDLITIQKARGIGDPNLKKLRF
jgi:hypothetical protein